MESTPAEHLSSEKILRAHLGGDSRAFAWLWRRYQRQMFAVALRYQLQPHDINDFLQEALLRAYRSASTFRGEASVATWLTRIVMNTILDYLRGRFGIAGNADNSAPLDSVEAVLPAQHHDWDQSLIVRDALATLPAEQRAALIALDVWGYRTSEYAAVVGAAPGTIKSRRSRARNAIRLFFGEEYEKRRIPHMIESRSSLSTVGLMAA